MWSLHEPNPPQFTRSKADHSLTRMHEKYRTLKSYILLCTPIGSHFFALIKQHERLGFFSILPKILLPRRSRIGRADSLDISLGTTISYNLLLRVQIVSLRFPYFALLLSFSSPGPYDYHKFRHFAVVGSVSPAVPRSLRPRVA